ncbi:MAG: MFS transporter [Crocinitomicaceae bacterium]|jgi:MFS family permease|nr:MFS transporter [Crocinitomicaceae bacterium]MDP5099483.1 MFS transporter [Crocinitomicaceae bacterium]
MSTLKSKDPYAAFRVKEFKSFLVIRFAMVFAWSMQFIVIEWEVYNITKDPLSLGLIGLLEIIPSLTVALFAGHFVDQNEKRGLLMKCIFGFSVISFALVFLTWEGTAEILSKNQVLWGIYACVFVGGIVRAFIGPTIFSLMSLIVPKNLYANAATWSSSAWQMGSVVGPALAGFTILWFGVSWSLAIVLIFSLIALVFLFSIEIKPIINKKIGEPILESLKEGVRFVFKTKEILGALTLDMIAVLFGGAIALLPIFATDILGVGAMGFGFLRAAPAVGSFLTMLIMAYYPIRKNAGMKLLFSIGGFGLSIILFGLSEWFWLSMVALFLSGVMDGISVIIRHTILQIYTPDDMRGRVASVNSMFVGSSNELGAFESGVTAKLFGTVRAVVGGGIMTILIVSYTGFKIPKLRKLEFTDQD